jgi:CDP-glycerol glycerophosphotransferase (TagB/SpsB family)
MPRYDKLENNPKKRILIMPTWRQYLKQKNKSKDTKESNNYFTNSEYFQFYNRLINDKRLLEKIAELGYEIKFCLHPSAIENAEYFEENDWVDISTEICNYSKEFSEGSLLVTDYSSVAFDFAYLRKPIIYSQFDPGELFEKHIYKRGYFDYKEDGFGPVCGDLDSTVNNIISILEGGCKLEEKYIKRINDFFRYKDRNNSERVYREISNI